MKREKSISTKAGRIKYIREKVLKVTQKYLFEKYNIPIVTSSKAERSANDITEKAIKKYIDIFTQEGIIISFDWLNNNIGPSPTIEYYKKKYLDEESDFEESNDDSLMIEYEVEDFTKRHKNAKVVRIMTEDMLPKFKSGDYVGGLFRDLNYIDSLIGKDCIVKIKGFEHFTVKRLTKCLNGSFNLSILNPNSTSTIPVIFDAKILEIYNIIWHRWPNNI